MNFPELPRQTIRPYSEQQEKEIWQPEWKCFCCQDTGKVQPNLVRLVIPDYDDWRDRLPICQLPGCGKNSYWMRLGDENLDMRLTPAICQELDMHERTAWRLTVERKAMNLRALTKKMSMTGVSDRTRNDNREIQQRKAEIEAIPPEDWLRMGDEYMYGKKKEDSD